jgi:hypothetical protein
MKMDVGLSLPKAAIVAIAAVVVIALALLVWIGGEYHYRNCLTEVEVRYPVTGVATAPASIVQRRQEAVSNCSRWP